MTGVRLTSADRVMVLAVHPDDESLCAGGLIQKAVAGGAKVRVIVVTDGDNNPWPQRFLERRWWISRRDRARWGARRRREAVAALAQLGVGREHITFWGLPDLGLTAILLDGGGELIARLSAEITEWGPTLLVAPSTRDLHPDHNSLAVLLDESLERSYPGRTRPFGLLEYLVHDRGRAREAGDVTLSLSPREVAGKRKAILSHQTQVALSRRRFLRFAATSESFWAAGEALRPSAVPAERAGSQLSVSFDRSTLGQAMLLLLRTSEGLVSYNLKVSGETQVSVFEALSGNLLMRGPLTWQGGRAHALLPTALFPPFVGVVAKAVGGRGIFDRSGWRQVPVTGSPHPEARAAGNLESSRVCCVIPCYNVGPVCSSAIRGAALIADDIIVVDDGSTDDTAEVLRAIAEEQAGNIQVLRLPTNSGKGVALMEAFRHAIATIPFDVLVTMDGDGQHRSEDIPRLARTLVGGSYDLVIGERGFVAHVPLRSRFGNSLTSLLLNQLFPGAPADTQSGFRAFRPELVREIVEEIQPGRYETELRMLMFALQRGHRIGATTIPTVYIDGNRLSHFRPLVDSFRIYSALFGFRGRAMPKPSLEETLKASP